MNQLMPIIRRKRRPLLSVEALPELPPVTVPVVENIQQATYNAQLPTEEVKEDGNKTNDSLPRRQKTNEKTSHTR